MAAKRGPSAAEPAGGGRLHDAVVTGAGDNGPVRSITPTGGGLSVLVVEASEAAGGAPRSGELSLPGAGRADGLAGAGRQRAWPRRRGDEARGRGQDVGSLVEDVHTEEVVT